MLRFPPLRVFMPAVDVQGLPVSVCLAWATPCVLGAGAAAANTVSGASALVGLARKVTVQSKVTKVPFNSSENPKSLQNESFLMAKRKINYQENFRCFLVL